VHIKQKSLVSRLKWKNKESERTDGNRQKVAPQGDPICFNCVSCQVKNGTTHLRCGFFLSNDQTLSIVPRVEWLFCRKRPGISRTLDIFYRDIPVKDFNLRWLHINCEDTWKLWSSCVRHKDNFKHMKRGSGRQQKNSFVYDQRTLGKICRLHIDCRTIFLKRINRLLWVTEEFILSALQVAAEQLLDKETDRN